VSQNSRAISSFSSVYFPPWIWWTTIGLKSLRRGRSPFRWTMASISFGVNFFICGVLYSVRNRGGGVGCAGGKANGEADPGGAGRGVGTGNRNGTGFGKNV